MTDVAQIGILMRMGESVDDAELHLVAAAVSAGATTTQIAQVLGRSQRTAARRLALPETQALIAEQRRQAANRIQTGVVETALAGLQRLHDVIVDPDSPPGAAVAASRYVLDLATKGDSLGVAAPPAPGEACPTCGHTELSEEQKAESMRELHDRLDRMRANQEACSARSVESTDGLQLPQLPPSAGEAC
jgi:DNA repair exonuclease SbcCD ATPase subunit